VSDVPTETLARWLYVIQRFRMRTEYDTDELQKLEHEIANVYLDALRKEIR
jgi:hypothetical protein